MVSGKIPLEQILLQRSVFCNKNVSVYWKEHIAHKPCHLVTVDDILLYAYTIGTMLDHKFPFCPLSFQYSYFITKKKCGEDRAERKHLKILFKLNCHSQAISMSIPMELLRA